MANITEPAAIAFANAYMRPLMERARDLQIALADAATEYTTNIAGVLAGYVDADVLADGREAEGVTQLTKLDLTQSISHLGAILAELNTAGADTLRAKFTVRPPRIN